MQRRYSAVSMRVTKRPLAVAAAVVPFLVWGCDNEQPPVVPPFPAAKPCPTVEMLTPVEQTPLGMSAADALARIDGMRDGILSWVTVDPPVLRTNAAVGDVPFTMEVQGNRGPNSVRFVTPCPGLRSPASTRRLEIDVSIFFGTGDGLLSEIWRQTLVFTDQTIGPRPSVIDLLRTPREGDLKLTAVEDSQWQVDAISFRLSYSDELPGAIVVAAHDAAQPRISHTFEVARWTFPERTP
jgi:hypothetical protein